MLRIVMVAYDDESNLVCRLNQQIDNDATPDWTELSYQFEEQLYNKLGEQE